MKIISVVGARPQFIKLAPLSRELRKYHNEIIIHTGQHYEKEMSDTFFKELDINLPNYNLNINSGSHGEQTGRMLIELEKVIINEKPDLIIVFGDTNSTLAGALVSSKLNILIIHIEAGLRSFNIQMPEEINRIVTDHISSYLFAPTKTAMTNLKIENLKKKSYLTGDIMVDSLNFVMQKSTTSNVLERNGISSNNYYLVTLHRPYNVDDPKNLFKILKEFSKLSAKVVFPVHPRTRKIIEHNNIIVSNNINLIKPVGYFDFVHLQSNAIKIITDSGGIQKEAYILKKPCITLRSETEWIETVEAGWNLLINPRIESLYYKKIENFIGAKVCNSIFGKNPVRKMMKLINNL